MTRKHEMYHIMRPCIMKTDNVSSHFYKWTAPDPVSHYKTPQWVEDTQKLMLRTLIRDSMLGINKIL